MNDFRMAYSVVRGAFAWGWWSWIASKWSGGGPRHVSYACARFNAYVYKCHVQDWLRGRV